jgi:peroxiredoxin
MPQRLGQGERAPDFILPSQDGTPTRFYAKAGGRPTALLFYTTDAGAELRQFAEALNDVSAGTVALIAVTCDDSTMHPPVSGGREDRVPIFADTQGKVQAAYRLEPTDTPTLFVLDPNLRVLASLSLQDAGSTARQVMAILNASLRQTDPLEMTGQAPVLLIPNVLDPQSCQALITLWETQGNVATGIEQSHHDRREDTIRPDIKRRRDHVVMDTELLRRLSSTIGRRVMPEPPRLKGALLLRQAAPDVAQAETCFHHALDIACRQEAKSLELRAATSLARLWQSQGKRQDAYDLLAPVYGWFTEGFDTADLKDAKALLDALA